jgi:general secretion pathway protein G
MSLQATPKKKPSLARALSRGVTLVEVMIVVVILGLIASGVAVAVLPKLKEAQIKTTTQNAMELRRISATFLADHSDQCPTPEALKAAKAVDSAAKTTDAWDSPFKIICGDDDEIYVVSFGPDKKEGTKDDIRVPAAEAR